MSDYTALALLKDIICWGGAIVLGAGVISFLLFAIIELFLRISDFIDGVGKHHD